MAKQNTRAKQNFQQILFCLPIACFILLFYFKISFFSIYIKYLYLSSYCLVFTGIFFVLSILFLIFSAFKFKKHYLFFSILVIFFSVQSITALENILILPINDSLMAYVNHSLFIFVLLVFFRSIYIYRKHYESKSYIYPFGMLLMYSFPFIIFYTHSSLLSGITAKWYEFRNMQVQYFIFDGDLKFSQMICALGLLIFCFQIVFDEKIYQKFLFSKGKSFSSFALFIIFFIIQSFLSNYLYAFNQQSIGRFMAASNLRKRAIIAFQKSLNVVPRNNETHRMLGTTFVSIGDFDKGFKHFMQAIAIKPEDPQAHINAGLVSIKRHNFSDAHNFFSQAIWKNPQNAEAHHYLGFVCSIQNQHDLAIIQFQESLRLNPDDENAHFHLALLLCKQKKHKQALGHFEEALWINPDFVEAYVQMGTLLFQLGAFEEAFAAYKKALHLKPDNDAAKKQFNVATKTAFDYAKQLAVQKKFDIAISIYQLVLKYRTDYSVSINYNIACLYAQKKQVKDSLEYLEKAVQMGYKDWDFFKKDTDFDAIRHQELFVNFINKQK